jgi:GT2 family glycosyltransferase
VTAVPNAIIDRNSTATVYRVRVPGAPDRLQLTCETPVGDGVRFAFDALDVRGSADGPAAIRAVEVRIAGRVVPLALRPSAPDDGAAPDARRFDGRVPVADLPRGVHRATVVASDADGHEAAVACDVDVQPFDELPEAAERWAALLADGVPVVRLERRVPDAVRPGWPATAAVTGFASCLQGLARLSLIVDRRHETVPFHGLYRPDLEALLASRVAVGAGFRAELLGVDSGTDRELVVLAVAPDGRATGWRGTLPARVDERPAAALPPLQPPPTLRANAPVPPGDGRPSAAEAGAERALRAEAAREAAEIDRSWAGLQTRLAVERAADAELARRAAVRRGAHPPAFPVVDAPVVSVVVTAYADAERTERCLRALAASAGAVPFEVIVVDDGDDRALRDLLDATVGARIVRNPANLGYLRSANRGAAAARGTHVALLNDDTEPQPGWLDALVRRLDEPDVGVVAPKLLFPDGRLQEAGSIVWSDGEGRNYGHGDDETAAIYNAPRDVDYGSAAGLLVRGTLWRAVGGFDERYRPAYYEDVDLCFAARARGLRVVYEPTARVVHAHGGSMGGEGLDLSRDLIETNRRVFCAKWATELRAQPRFRPDAIDAAAARPAPA